MGVFYFIFFYLTFKCIVAYRLLEHQGRLKSQFRVFPVDGIPSAKYACPRHGILLCSRDLRGFHTCNRGILSPVTYCPAETRCGCHLDGVCHLNESEACVPKLVVHPMPERATFFYHGYTTKNFLALYPRDNKEKKLLWGVVKQDKQTGHYLQINTNDYEPFKTFELIVPDGEGRFVKYVGTDKECQNTTISHFQPFGYDISNYHLEDVKFLTTHRSLQNFAFKVSFQGPVWTDLSWKWTLMADTKTNTSLPAKSFFFEAGRGPLYKQYVFWDVSTLDAPLKDETKWYGMEKGDHDWFQVPDVCK